MLERLEEWRIKLGEKNIQCRGLWDCRDSDPRECRKQRFKFLSKQSRIFKSCDPASKWLKDLT